MIEKYEEWEEDFAREIAEAVLKDEFSDLQRRQNDIFEGIKQRLRKQRRYSDEKNNSDDEVKKK